MGDRCYVRIELRGELKRPRLIYELPKILESEGFGEVELYADQDKWQRSLLIHHLQNREVTYDILDHEVNYGNTEDIEGVLEKYGQCYTIFQGSGGEYGEELRSFDPTAGSCGTCYSCLAVDEAVITLTDLKHLIGKPALLAERINEMEKASGEGLPEGFWLSDGIFNALAKRHAKWLAEKALDLPPIKAA